jgi:hypothetical protein
VLVEGGGGEMFYSLCCVSSYLEVHIFEDDANREDPEMTGQFHVGGIIGRFLESILDGSASFSLGENAHLTAAGNVKIFWQHKVEQLSIRPPFHGNIELGM